MRFLITILTVALLAIVPTCAMGAGTVTAEVNKISNNVRTIVLTCTGDSSDGTIPDTSTDDMVDTDGDTVHASSFIEGFFLFRVVVENDSGDTDVTDDSDVYIKHADGTDMLDGDGVDQLDDDTVNYIRLYEYDPVLDAITLDVDNQATASGVYTITLVFVR